MVGPLTLKQFIYIGIGAGISLTLYMISTTSKNSFPLPVCLAIDVIIMGIAGALAFIRVNGISLPILLKNSFSFGLAPKIFLWKKFPTKTVVNPNQQMIKIAKAPTSKKADLVTKKSELKKLRNYMETKG